MKEICLKEKHGQEWACTCKKCTVNNNISFTIPGNAVAQGRPRFARRGRFVHTYDPPKSKAWKEYVRLCAIAAKCKPLDGPLSMQIVFFLRPPKNLDKKLARGEGIAHISKPDCSNLVKALEDALTGICYHDDSQIVDLSATKCYSAQPQVFVSITTIEPERAGRGERTKKVDSDTHDMIQ